MRHIVERYATKRFEAWYLEPRAIQEVLKIWGITKTRFSEAEVKEGEEVKFLPRGDAVAAAIKMKYGEKKEVPSVISPFFCGDPVQATYEYLEKQGYKVCIPAD